MALARHSIEVVWTWCEKRRFNSRLLIIRKRFDIGVSSDRLFLISGSRERPQRWWPKAIQIKFCHANTRRSRPGLFRLSGRRAATMCQQRHLVTAGALAVLPAGRTFYGSRIA